MRLWMINVWVVKPFSLVVGNHVQKDLGNNIGKRQTFFLMHITITCIEDIQ